MNGSERCQPSQTLVAECFVSGTWAAATITFFSTYLNVWRAHGRKSVMPMHHTWKSTPSTTPRRFPVT